MKFINEYKGYCVGDHIIITNRPRYWSSLLNNKYPLYLNFPYKCKIKRISKSEDGVISMTDGEYGWDFGDIIEDNIIQLDIIALRKEKLNILNSL